LEQVSVYSLRPILYLRPFGNALAADSNLAWNESNIKTLRTLNKADVAALVNELPPANGSVIHPEPADIGEFAWADLEGNGTYQLLVTQDVNGRHFYNSVVIYSRDSSGRLASQEIRGWAIRNLANVIKDINGGGKDELIVPSQLPSDTYRGAAGMAIWPAVYREKNGHYLEASGEFPSFYESQVLPELDRKIAEVRQKLDKGLATAHDLAIAIMARDKVLRVIGRDPRAGEREARKWMTSQDPELRSDAAAVLGDMGGHEDDLRALKADGNSSVAHSAQFAMSHGASSIQRFNSAALSGSSE
jgi:hypothetical protein